MFIMSFTFSIWQVLLNNFVIERAHFSGVEIGILQSVREIPGFLAFTAVFLLYVFKEQTFALLSLSLMAMGVAITGFFPQATALYLTTFIMSTGFHYFETMNKSLTLQWLDKNSTPHFMGKAMSIKAIASLTAYAVIWFFMDLFNVDYKWMYFTAGVVALMATIFITVSYPKFKQKSLQTKKLILKKRYWLYYALTFFSGARRQIFMVFAGFMMVEKFAYSVGQISLLFMINYTFNFLFAARIGKWIGRIGEHKALIIEYTGLIIIFSGYAMVSNAHLAAALYVLDHLFFAFAIAINTYFQKIAASEDIASTASVSFSINHIAAIVIPAILGILWVHSSTLVFAIGVLFAICSLLLALNIPNNPEQGNETRWTFKPQNSQIESEAKR